MSTNQRRPCREGLDPGATPTPVGQLGVRCPSAPSAPAHPRSAAARRQLLRELPRSLTGRTNVTNQLRANSGAMDKNGRHFRTHALIGTALSGEIDSVFCERIQMRSDAGQAGCRTATTASDRNSRNRPTVSADPSSAAWRRTDRDRRRRDTIVRHRRERADWGSLARRAHFSAFVHANRPPRGGAIVTYDSHPS